MSSWEFPSLLDLRTVLSGYGRGIISQVLAQDNLWDDVVSAYFDSHTHKYLGLGTELSKLTDLLRQGFLPAVARDRIARFVELLTRRDYIGALRVVFPEIEGILNLMLERLGDQPDLFPGWRAKVEYLESRKVIPADLSRLVQIIEGRNRVVHGQFAPSTPSMPIRSVRWHCST